MNKDLNSNTASQGSLGSKNPSQGLQYKDNWKQIQTQARQRWSDLTQDDLSQAEGSRDYLLSTVQKRCGISRDQAEQQVSDFERGFQSNLSSTQQRSGSQSQSDR